MAVRQPCKNELVVLLSTQQMACSAPHRAVIVLVLPVLILYFWGAFGPLSQGEREILQKNAAEPKLATAGQKIEFSGQSSIVDFEVTNTGQRAARQGVAVLFWLTENRARGQKLGEAPLLGAGTNVLPHYNGRATIRFDGATPPLFLVCAAYSDDDDKIIKQAFVLRVNSNQTALDDLGPQNYQVCK
jgi:hypothetical protein